MRLRERKKAASRNDASVSKMSGSIGNKRKYHEMDTKPTSNALQKPIINGGAAMVVIPRAKSRDVTIGTTNKRPHTHDNALIGFQHTQEPNCTSRNASRDECFADDVVASLSEKISSRSKNFGHRQARRVLQLLRIASPANAQEAIFLGGEEAAKYLKPQNFHEGPIFAQGQQRCPLMSVEEFLSEFYDDEAEIWIQDPAAKLPSDCTREVKVRDLKRQFSKTAGENPWNCLEVASPIEDGTRPAFLNHEDCRLLSKIKIPKPGIGVSGAKVGRYHFDAGYKEVEKWVLLAQAGALSEPHQDSHGFSTYITVNSGKFGFGWLSYPSPEERAGWLRNPLGYTGGRWRYVVLEPGQTVYFPAGTVHFVFRHPSVGNTLAFGGHILRCSTIVPWVKSLLDEKAAEDITNEDLTVSALGYLEQIERFVKQAKASKDPRDVEKWGGTKSVEEFMRLKSLFLEE